MSPIIAVLLVLSSGVDTTAPPEKTAFQTASAWLPQIDVRSDIAIVYGVKEKTGMTFQRRVDSWRERGYVTHFMTGIAWGAYDEYFLGAWDGKTHLGIGQVQKDGDTIWHGHNIPYVVPEATYLDYMKRGVVKKVIDAGISSMYLEEPEFWARAGYSDVFKSEWKKYYGFPWRPQDASPENTYLSSKLKYHLYYNAIKEVSSFAKKYGKTRGMNVKVYIPTHSLVNYSSWNIVSPEASLASLSGIDGYIAQVWTGTSREPIFFNGIKKERVFENAFLEYGSMVSMTAPTKRKVFFLTDPIEDWPRDWSDYRRNYQATFTAKLLYPMVNNYEVMPWPERIYTRPYKVANSDTAVLIPKTYSTQMQVMVNALNDMPLSNNHVSGNNGIGVLMGNSLMFQRFPEHAGYEDPAFSDFYGQTLPLLKRGVPVQTVHMENLKFPATLANIHVLVMSYSNMKPMSPDVHSALALWVKNGGVLIYCGRDQDPYQSVMEWWNTGGRHFKAPSEHLFLLLGIKPDTNGYAHTVGRGAVFVLRTDPKDFVLDAGGDSDYISTVREAFEKYARGGKLLFKNAFFLQRGPYQIVSVMDESISSDTFVVHGSAIDLFDPLLPVVHEQKVAPGSQAFLYNLNYPGNNTQPKVVASAGRVYNEIRKGNSYRFVLKSPLNTVNAMRIRLPAKPLTLSASHHDGKKAGGVVSSYDEDSHTAFVSFDNDPDGITVDISW